MKTRSSSPIPKHNRIVQHIRSQIVRGQLAPSQALPGHAELSRKFNVASMTVRVALRQLMHEGWIETRERVGTFVVAHPPHRTNYALVFWNEPHGYTAWSKYYAALTEAARQLDRVNSRRIQLFHGIDQHVDTDDYQNLLGLVQAQRLAGLVFANNPFWLVHADSPLLTQPDMPLVTFSAKQERLQAHSIEFNGGWFERALTEAAAQGRRRVAFLSLEMSDDHERHVVERARQLGLETRPAWWQVAAPLQRKSARRATQLLFDAEPAQRPNALLIADDNLVEEAVAGLMAAGLRVPDDVAVVAHANFPLPTPTAIPMRRLGLDLRVALATALAIIDRQRSGQAPLARVPLPAVFEEELAERTARPELALAQPS